MNKLLLAFVLLITIHSYQCINWKNERNMRSLRQAVTTARENLPTDTQNEFFEVSVEIEDEASFESEANTQDSVETDAQDSVEIDASNDVEVDASDDVEVDTSDGVVKCQLIKPKRYAKFESEQERLTSQLFQCYRKETLYLESLSEETN